MEQMLFDGFPLPKRGATLAVGPSKTGKTLLAVQQALAVASGKPLFENYKTLMPGPVLIVEQDDPAGAASIAAIRKRSGHPAGLPLFVAPLLPFDAFGPELLRVVRPAKLPSARCGWWCSIPTRRYAGRAGRESTS